MDDDKRDMRALANWDGIRERRERCSLSEFQVADAGRGISRTCDRASERPRLNTAEIIRVARRVCPGVGEPASFSSARKA